ncbi:MAG: WD40 repeat domain-containing protein, partial [Anaerolineales bacterium]
MALAVSFLLAACAVNPPSIGQSPATEHSESPSSSQDGEVSSQPLIGLEDVASILPPVLLPISAQNADRLAQVAQLGRGEINDLAWSPDGKSLAMASTLGIYLYDATTQEALWFKETDDWQTTIAFARDGSQIVSGGRDGKASIWDAASGDLLLQFSAHDQAVTRVLLSPDSRLAITLGAEEGVVELWDAKTGQRLRTLQGGELSSDAVARTIEGGETIEPGGQVFIRDIDVSPNGEVLAAVSDRSLRLWEIDTGALRAVVPMPKEAISVAFSPSGELLATSHRGAFVWLRRGTNGQPLRRVDPEARHVNVDTHTVAFGEDENTLVASGTDGRISLWDLETRNDPMVLNDHRVYQGLGYWGNARPELVGGAEEWRLALAAGGTAWLWQAGDAEPYSRFSGHQDAIKTLNIMEGGSSILTVSSTAVLWDLNNGHATYSFNEPASAPTAYAVSPMLDLLAGALGDGTIVVWDLETLKLTELISLPVGWAHMLVFSPDGEFLANLGGGVYVWNIEDGALVLDTFSYRTIGDIDDIFFRPDGASFGMVGMAAVEGISVPRPSVVLYDLVTGALLNRVDVRADVPGDLSQFSSIELRSEYVLHSVEKLGQAGRSAFTRLIEPTAWKTIYTMEGSRPSFVPTGSLIATSDDKGNVWIWDYESGALIHELA